MEWVETTGTTVAEAIERALDRLGVAESDAEVVILEEPKSSIFGLRKTTARVRARVRPVQARAKRPSRRPAGGSDGKQRTRANPRSRGDGDGSGSKAAPTRKSSRNGATDGADGPAQARQARPARPQPKEAQGEQSSSKPRRNRNRKSAAAAGREEAPDAGTPKRPQTKKSRADGSRSGSKAVSVKADENARQSTGAIEEEEMSIETQAELAEQFVRGVVERFGLDANTTSEIAEDTVRIDVTGENVGLLIGPRGATADALQELTRTAVQHRSDDHGVRIMVDVGGYRLRRATALRQFAGKVAAEVVATGEPQALDPMSAADRKVVHDAVNEIDGARTTSEGDDPRRYVVIHPVQQSDTEDDQLLSEQVV
ncbi:MAG: RNA-binding cell elongation regulator Jag/EloR [Acidimicrobiales bacterium]